MTILNFLIVRRNFIPCYDQNEIRGRCSSNQNFVWSRLLFTFVWL